MLETDCLTNIQLAQFITTVGSEYFQWFTDIAGRILWIEGGTDEVTQWFPHYNGEEKPQEWCTFAEGDPV